MVSVAENAVGCDSVFSSMASHRRNPFMTMIVCMSICVGVLFCLGLFVASFCCSGGLLLADIVLSAGFPSCF